MSNFFKVRSFIYTVMGENANKQQIFTNILNTKQIMDQLKTKLTDSFANSTDTDAKPTVIHQNDA